LHTDVQGHRDEDFDTGPVSTLSELSVTNVRYKVPNEGQPIAGTDVIIAMLTQLIRC